MENQFFITPYFLDEPLPELELLKREGWLINAPNLLGESKQERMSIGHRSLATLVKETMRRGLRPVSIAGDCCSAIGVLAGLQRFEIDPTLIWLDAHGDFNTWETTPSGFLGGMPLAMIVGRGEQTMTQAVSLTTIEEKRVILTDGRDLDPGEQEAITDSEIIFLPDVKDLLSLELPPGPIWVHFDTDTLTPDEAPAQNYPASGGPSSDLLRSVFERLAQSGQIAAVSVSTWNPNLDEDGQSKNICMSLLDELTKSE